jgi:hypothetical protein
MRAMLTKATLTCAAAALLFAPALGGGARCAFARQAQRPAAPSAGGVAVSLEDYGARLGRAARALEEVAAFCDELARGEDPEVWSGGEFDPDRALELPAREENALTAVRRLLPPVERVTAGGQTHTADNRWLADTLAEYERQSAQLENEKRAEALRAAAGRLRSLQAALGEEAAATRRDKDAEKGRLNSILRRPEFDRETAKGGALQRLVEDTIKWLRDLLPEIKPLRPGTGARVSQGAQYLVFGVCLLVLAYLGWRLLRSRRLQIIKPGRRRGPRVVLGERLEEDQTAADLLEEAERLARSGDARSAIRKAYVALLVELGDRGVLRLAQHRTNHDYLRAARETAPPPLYDELLPLTLDYELHWYGLRPAAEGDWRSFRDRCRQALRIA